MHHLFVGFVVFHHQQVISLFECVLQAVVMYFILVCFWLFLGLILMLFGILRSHERL
jgi:hypothetical protein